MDDSLEIPNTPLGQNLGTEEDEQSSEEEYDGPDWTKLLSGIARPVIPKRGEKDFEPAPGGGSGLQLHILERARYAMFDALKATRNSTSKSISYGIWDPDIARVHVTLARGIHFSVMGHSTPRPLPVEGYTGKAYKRLELLPEEAIYLVERGALFCWKRSNLLTENAFGMEDVQGSPMSVHQAYSEMIGMENLTLDKYQVFAYLKRLGYVVTRADPPTTSYPIPPPFLKTAQARTVTQRLRAMFSYWLSKFFRPLTASFNWWRPLRLSYFLYHDKNYASLFKALRFIPSGHNVPLLLAKPSNSQYKIFFNLYKPSTPFRKSAPPPPDFSVVVVDARTTLMPSLGELSVLFDALPELPPPLPRQKRQVTTKSVVEPSVPLSLATSAPVLVRPSLFQSLFPWVFRPPPIGSSTLMRRPNPFMALKAGNKAIIIAVVDVGNISFFRFGQGAFSEWPMT